MKITLYTNNSEKNKLEKNLTNAKEFSGNLREESSIVNPSILIQTENPSSYNYAYIPEFKRYYFIIDAVSVRTNIWRISLHCDVLMSFKNEIKGTQVILSDTEVTGQTNYMAGEQWASTVKTATDIVSFPNTMNIGGDYILITAGGPGNIQ